MKKLILLLLILFPLRCVAQTSFYSDRAISPQSVLGIPTPVAAPVSYAGVRVCSLPLTQQQPCLPLANITDINGTPLSNSIGSNFGQMSADVTGRFTFGCTTGANLQLQYSGASNTPQGNYPITCPGSGLQAGGAATISGAWNFTGPVTHSGPETFKNINLRQYCDQFAGATADAKITACLAALPSGGIADASAITGAQSWSGMVTISTPNTQLLLAPSVTFSCTANALTAGQAMLRIQADNVKVQGYLNLAEALASSQIGTIFRCPSTGLTSTSDLIQLNPSPTGRMNGLELSGLTLDFANTSANSGRHGIAAYGLNKSYIHDIGIWNAGADGWHAESTPFHSYDVDMARIYIRAVAANGFFWTTVGASYADLDRWTCNLCQYLGYNPGDNITRFGTAGMHLQVGNAVSQSLFDFSFKNAFIAGIASNAANAFIWIDQSGSPTIGVIDFQGEVEDPLQSNSSMGLKISSAAPALVQQIKFWNQAGYANITTTTNLSTSNAYSWNFCINQPQTCMTDGLALTQSASPGSPTPNPIGGLIFGKTPSAANTVALMHMSSDGILRLTRTDVLAEALATDIGNTRFMPGVDNVWNLGADPNSGAFAWKGVYRYSDFLQETTAPTAVAGKDVCYGDSTAHALKCSYNNGSFLNIPQVIASGTLALNTASITTATCDTGKAATATGALSTDSVMWSFNAAPSATNKYGAFLVVYAVPSANTVTFYTCNPSATTSTPTAMTVNWSVGR